MNYFVDALNKLFEIYYESCKKFNYIEDEVTEEEKKDYLETVYIDVSSQILDLSNIDGEEFRRFVSLLILEYYNNIIRDVIDAKGYYPEEDLVLVKLIEKISVSDLLIKLQDENIEYLVDIVATLIEEYDPNEEIELEYYDYDYALLEDLLQLEQVQNVYKKFHPNLIGEMSMYQEYIKELEIDDKIMDLDTKNLFEFIYTSLNVKKLVKDFSGYAPIMIRKIWTIKEDNEKLYDDIIVYLTRLFYAKNKNKKDIDKYEYKFLQTIMEEPREDAEYAPDTITLLKYFYNYDIMTDNKLIEDVEEETKEYVKKYKILD